MIAKRGEALSQAKFARLDDVILKHAESSPEKIAVRYRDRAITYAALNARVNTLALHMYNLGVKPGTFVTVFLDPAEDIIVAMLAIFRLGAIYAPLDPMHPDSQIQDRIETITPVAMVAQGRYRERISGFGVTPIYIDDLEPAEITQDIRLEANQADPACIFFTSGSTGKPKAVLGSYEAVSASIIEPSEALGITADDTLDSIARYAWSISMLEMMAALVQGGSTLVLDRQKALDLAWLAEQAAQCTAFHAPPALLDRLAEYIQENGIETEFLGVALVWYGGDILSEESITRLHHVFKNARIATAYGTTEIFGLSHCHFYKRQNRSGKVLIGQPVGSIEQIILGDDGIPVKFGEVGEIYLGGPRVAREYYHQPDLTLEKFPVFSGKRYFSTGDFARLHPDGNLEYLNRKDDQVKIRGIRVDLGEIVYHLKSQDIVKDAVVIAKESIQGSKELHAFVVFHGAAEANIKKIRTFLDSVLPDYMVPAVITELESLPYTENYKIDRKWLAAYTPPELPSENAFKNSSLALLADLWVKSGTVAPRSETDNFFEIGGSSISAISLVESLRRTVGLHLEVADIYRNPTLDQQADLVCKSDQLTSRKMPDEVNGSFSQVGLFFREIFDGRGASIVCTRYITCEEGYDDDLVKESLAMLVARYKTLRTSVTPKGSGLKLDLGGSPSASDIGFERLSGVWTISGNRSVQAFEEKPYKFDLRKDTLISALCCQLDTGEELLQLTVHHIAADNNSAGRLAADFVQIYDALRHGSEPNLLALTSEYDEYLADQQYRLEAGCYDQRAREVGDKLLRALAKISSDSIFSVDADDTQAIHFIDKLEQDVAKNYEFTDVIAAMSLAFFQQFGRREFVFCAHVALRRDTPSNPQVGMFVNLVPIFLTVNPQHDFSQHAAQTRREFEEAMARSDVPYELILRSQEELRRLRRFPFDGFVNELDFAEDYPKGYRGVVVPRKFATDGGAISLSVLQTKDGSEIKIEGPALEKGQDVLESIGEKIMDELKQAVPV